MEILQHYFNLYVKVTLIYTLKIKRCYQWVDLRSKHFLDCNMAGR